MRDHRTARADRTYTTEYRRQVAVAACEPGVSVAKLAQAYGLNPNMVFKWRRQLRAALFDGAAHGAAVLLPVALPDAPTGETPEPASLALPPVEPHRESVPAASGIEIELNGAPVRVTGMVDPVQLRLVPPSVDCTGAASPSMPRRISVTPAASHTRVPRGGAIMLASGSAADPFSGHVFLFRGRLGDLIKILWWSGDGMNLYAN